MQVSGTVYGQTGALASGRGVRVYRRDTGALLGATTTGDGVSAAVPVFKSNALNTIGSVSTGDFVFLFLVNPTTVVEAPTGWTRIVNSTDNESNKIMVFHSNYDVGNAVANTTNFPIGNGYFITMVYSGPCTIQQTGTLTYAVAGNANVTATALTNPTTAGSALIGWATSRGPSNTSITESTTMTRRSHELAMTYFDAAVFEELGVKSGTRTFTRTGDTSFSFSAVLIELKSTGTPVPLGQWTVDVGSFSGATYSVILGADSGSENALVFDRVLPV